MVSKYFQNIHKRLLYIGTALVTAVIVTILTPQPGQAVSWLEILLRGAQIIQVSNISDQQEMQLGAATNQQILQQLKVHPSREINAYVDGIGQKLARVSARPNIKYTFQVIQDDSINAFATMGGYVYVNSGLMKMADNEAQLAGVIGHEIGHITGRHSIEQMKQRMIASGISSIAGVDQSTLAQLGVELALRRPRSRADEYDADRRGLDSLIRANYAPSAMPEFMKKLNNASSPPTFLSTHPSPPDRVANLQRLTPVQYRSQTYGLETSSYRQRVQSYLGSGTYKALPTASTPLLNNSGRKLR
jgi:beta-barrel assembly-enhancing protease